MDKAILATFFRKQNLFVIAFGLLIAFVLYYPNTIGFLIGFFYQPIIIILSLLISIYLLKNRFLTKYKQLPTIAIKLFCVIISVQTFFLWGGYSYLQMGEKKLSWLYATSGASATIVLWLLAYIIKTRLVRTFVFCLAVSMPLLGSLLINGQKKSSQYKYTSPHRSNEYFDKKIDEAIDEVLGKQPPSNLPPLLR